MSPQFRPLQRGLSLIELIIFIVIISVGVLGILSVLNTTAKSSADPMIGKQVLAVVNFPPRQIGPIRSEVLVLGLPDKDNQVVLIGPDKPVPIGGRMY